MTVRYVWVWRSGDGPILFTSAKKAKAYIDRIFPETYEWSFIADRHRWARDSDHNDGEQLTAHREEVLLTLDDKSQTNTLIFGLVSGIACTVVFSPWALAAYARSSGIVLRDDQEFGLASVVGGLALVGTLLGLIIGFACYEARRR